LHVRADDPNVDGEKQGSRIRWGLIPFFAKGEAGKYSTINARIETVETAASYRGPWKLVICTLTAAAGGNTNNCHQHRDAQRCPA
jgi:putative SOS response-associated peptidase YedK